MDNELRSALADISFKLDDHTERLARMETATEITRGQVAAVLADFKLHDKNDMQVQSSIDHRLTSIEQAHKNESAAKADVAARLSSIERRFLIGGGIVIGILFVSESGIVPKLFSGILK